MKMIKRALAMNETLQEVVNATLVSALTSLGLLFYLLIK